MATYYWEFCQENGFVTFAGQHPQNINCSLFLIIKVRCVYFSTCSTWDILLCPELPTGFQELIKSIISSLKSLNRSACAWVGPDFLVSGIRKFSSGRILSRLGVVVCWNSPDASVFLPISSLKTHCGFVFRPVYLKENARTFISI